MFVCFVLAIKKIYIVRNAHTEKFGTCKKFNFSRYSPSPPPWYYSPYVIVGISSSRAPESA